MTRTLCLAIALALCVPVPAFAQAATTAAKTEAPAAKPAPAWVAKSNAYTQQLILAQAPFNPEQLSFFGIPGYDDKTFDFGPGYGERFRAATAKARDALQASAATEADPNVKQDLAILVQAADDAIEASAVNEKLTRPWLDVGQTVFGGMQGLLSDQTPADRRAKALDRLKRYVGQVDGATPLVTLARQRYDDFNFPAVAWTLTAHEGRPGHELQFTAMVERGVSLARTLYAFNSVNVEGWALYAEAEMVPYEPVEGQFFALQFRLLRAARAMLDPMLNLGLTDRDTAKRVLMEDVGLSNAMATQEIDRYTVRSPGQAGSYFYGYSRILQLRAETELALGDRFDRRKFNDFLLDQGLLPPDLLAKAVRETFVPSQRGGAAAAK